MLAWPALLARDPDRRVEPERRAIPRSTGPMKVDRSTGWIAASLAAALAAGCSNMPTPSPTARAPITVANVNAAQQRWCDGLLSIAKAHAEGRDYVAQSGAPRRRALTPRLDC
jgi:hypothetical protein